MSTNHGVADAIPVILVGIGRVCYSTIVYSVQRRRCVCPAFLDVDAQVPHVPEHHLCRKVLGKKIRRILRSCNLTHLGAAVASPLLYPQVLDSDVSQLTKALTTHDAQRSAGIRPDLRVETDPEIRSKGDQSQRLRGALDEGIQLSFSRAGPGILYEHEGKILPQPAQFFQGPEC